MCLRVPQMSLVTLGNPFDSDLISRNCVVESAIRRLWATLHKPVDPSSAPAATVSSSTEPWYLDKRGPFSSTDAGVRLLVLLDERADLPLHKLSFAQFSSVVHKAVAIEPLLEKLRADGKIKFDRLLQSRT
jgi:hypothetical protein